MNEKNLIPFSERTAAEAREIGSKGGKASVAARRRKKTMKQVMSMLLSMPANTHVDYEILLENGIDVDQLGEDLVNNMLVVNTALLAKAKTGDVAAYKEITSVIGEDNAAAEFALKKKELKLREQNMPAELAETPKLYDALEGGDDDV